MVKLPPQLKSTVNLPSPFSGCLVAVLSISTLHPPERLPLADVPGSAERHLLELSQNSTLRVPFLYQPSIKSQVGLESRA
jgi:hypothetical protein